MVARKLMDLVEAIQSGRLGEQAGDDPEGVAQLISDMVHKADSQLPSDLDIALFKELAGLAKFIDEARQEIAAIRPDKASGVNVANATDELDAVVAATEEATGKILDASESIQTIAEAIEQPHQDKIIDLVTGIFEASNFQDITGQRISKVVRTIKHIEAKIDSLVVMMGGELKSSGVAVEEVQPAKPMSDEDLLNGPQLSRDAIDQSEIDKLLADFD